MGLWHRPVGSEYAEHSDSAEQARSVGVEPGLRDSCAWTGDWSGAMMQPWLIVSLLFLGLIGLNISFFLCARAIKRDMTSRFDELERRLESRATDLVNHLFYTNRS